MAVVVEDIRSIGITSLGAIADELNARGMLTRRGRWQADRRGDGADAHAEGQSVYHY